MRNSWLLAALAVTATALFAPAGAGAARGIDVGFAEPRFNNIEDGERARWFDRAKLAGGQWARVTIGWRAVTRREPANPANPADPAYNFRVPDAAIRDAAARGMNVLLTIATAPRWAEGPNRRANALAGTWKPNPGDLANLGRALARRYSGNFQDPLRPARTLPKVSSFEPWNEANLEAFLTPQREGGRLVADDHYKKMLNAFYGAVHAIQPGANVVGGSLSPIGSDGGRPGKARTGPLEFLRELFCLKGKKLRKLPCPTPPRMDVLSHHPINADRPPSDRAGDDDAGIAETPDIRKILDTASKSGRVQPGGKKQLWMTEIWWNSNPPKKSNTAPSLKQQANYIQEGLYMLWKERVSLAMLYQVGDEARLLFQSGVFFENGRPKPSLTAIRFPLVGDRKSKKKVLVWGRTPKSGKVKIQVRSKGKRGFRTKAKVKAKRPGTVFKKTLRIRGKAKLRAKQGKQKSLTWKVGKR